MHLIRCSVHLGGESETKEVSGTSKRLIFCEEEREMPHYTQEPEIHSFSFYRNTTSSGLKKYKPSVKPLNEIKGMDGLEGSVEQFKY